MLAIVRSAPLHSFLAGFSAEALSSRILDSDCSRRHADGAFRRGAPAAQAPVTRLWSPVDVKASWSFVAPGENEVNEGP